MRTPWPSAMETAPCRRLSRTSKVTICSPSTTTSSPTGKQWYGQCRLPIVEDEQTLALFTILTPFPGTALFERLDREGRIINRNWDDYTMDKCVFQPRHFSPEGLTGWLNRAEKEFFSLRSIRERSKFGMNYSYPEKFLAVNLLRNIGLKFVSNRG